MSNSDENDKDGLLSEANYQMFLDYEDGIKSSSELLGSYKDYDENNSDILSNKTELKKNKEVNIYNNCIPKNSVGNNFLLNEDDKLNEYNTPTSNKKSNQKLINFIDNKKNEVINESKKGTKENTLNPILKVTNNCVSSMKSNEKIINIIDKNNNGPIDENKIKTKANIFSIFLPPTRKDHKIRAVKSFAITILFNCGNCFIKEYQYDNFGKEIKIELLKKINLRLTRDCGVEFNKDLLGWTIKEVFSYESDYNKKLIEKYYIRDIIIEKFFDMKFQEIFINIETKEIMENKIFQQLAKEYMKLLKGKKEKIKIIITKNYSNFNKLINNRKSKKKNI